MRRSLELAGRRGKSRFSPDGTRLASLSGDGKARIWDIVPAERRAIRQPLRVIETGMRGLDPEIAFGDEGRSILTSSRGLISTWEVSPRDGQVVVDAPKSTRFIDRAASADGSRFAAVFISADSNVEIKAWDQSARILFKATEPLPGAVATQSLVHLTLDRDGSRLAVCINNVDSVDPRKTLSRLIVRDVSTGREIDRRDFPGVLIRPSDFSPDGRRLALSSSLPWKTSGSPSIASSILDLDSAGSRCP